MNQKKDYCYITTEPYNYQLIDNYMAQIIFRPG